MDPSEHQKCDNTDNNDVVNPYDSYSDDEEVSCEHYSGSVDVSNTTAVSQSVAFAERPHSPMHHTSTSGQHQQQQQQQQQPQKNNSHSIQRTRKYVDQALERLHRILKDHKPPVSKKQRQKATNMGLDLAHALEPILVTQSDGCIEGRIRQLLQQRPQHYQNKLGSNIPLPAPPILVVWGSGTLELAPRKVRNLLDPSALAERERAEASKHRFLEETCRHYSIPYVRLEDCRKLHECFPIENFRFRQEIFGVMVTLVKPNLAKSVLKFRKEARRLHDAIGFLLQEEISLSGATGIAMSIAAASVTASTSTADNLTDDAPAEPPSKKPRLEALYASNQSDSYLNLRLQEQQKKPAMGTAATTTTAPLSQQHPQSEKGSLTIAVEPEKVNGERSIDEYVPMMFALQEDEEERPTAVTGPVPPVNRETVHMEEEVTRLEILVKGLRERKRSLVQELETAETTLHHLTAVRTPVLESQVSILQSTLNRQSYFHVKISQSLAKRRNSLARLLVASDDMTVEEIAKLAIEHDGIDREADVDLGGGSSTTDDAAPVQVSAVAQHEHDKENSNNTGVLPEETTIIALYRNSTSTKEILVRALEYPILFEGIEDKLNVLAFENAKGLNQLWQQRDTNDKISGFLPCLRSIRVIKEILDVSCRETLALDEQLFPNAQDRRDSFRNTCLDARLLSADYYVRLEQTADPMYRSGGDSGGGKSRGGAPDAQVNGSTMTATSVATTTATTRIDPTVTLCPYELAGVCADASCSYQHLQERSFGQILPREYIPLVPPRLSGSETTASADKSSTEVGQKTQVGPPPSAHWKNRSDRNGDGDERAYDAVAQNEDFVFLPDSRPDDGSQDDCSVSSCDALDCQDTHSWKWWHSPIEPSVRPSGDNLMSFIDALRSFGCELVHDQLSIEAPLDMIQGCLFCGKVVESFRLALHAGRFDVTIVLVEYAAEIARSWCKPDHSQLVSTLASICLKVVETLEHVHEFAYAYDSFHEFLIESVGTLSEVALNEWFHEAEELLALHEFLLVKPAGQQTLGDVKPFVATDEDDSSQPHGFTDAKCGMGLKANHRHRLYRLLMHDAFHRNSSQAIDGTSVASLIHDFLHPSWDKAKELLLDSESKTYGEKFHVHARVICQMVNSCLCALECAISQSGAASKNSIVTAELSQLHSAVHKILVWLQRLAASSNPTLEFMITPVVAANNSLACTAQMYDTTQRGLVRLLASRPEGAGFTHLSEMLWSQLIQLRMTLPPFARGEEPRVPCFQLPDSVSEANELIARRVNSMGVFPHHVSLSGDWNLIRRHNEQQGNDEQLVFRRNCRDLVLALHHPLSVRFDLNDYQLKLRNPSPEFPFLLRSPLPHSLLVTGASIVALELKACGLKSLPFHFGHYFPILENLFLDRNQLKELPSSLSHIKSLVILKVDGNGLEHLPSSFVFPKLTEVSVEGNKLVDLPESIGECQDLQLLALRRNNFAPSYDFASLATRLPKLRTLATDGGAPLLPGQVSSSGKGNAI